MTTNVVPLKVSARATKAKRRSSKRADRVLAAAITERRRELLSGQAKLDEWQRIAELVMLDLGKAEREFSGAAFFAHDGRIVDHELRLFVGGWDRVLTDPRIIAERAIAAKARSVVVWHNHPGPGGVAKPSRADLANFAVLRVALATLDIRLHDEWIVTDGEIFSFRQHGLADETPQEFLGAAAAPPGGDNPWLHRDGLGACGLHRTLLGAYDVEDGLTQAGRTRLAAIAEQAAGSRATLTAARETIVNLVRARPDGTCSSSIPSVLDALHLDEHALAELELGAQRRLSCLPAD